MKHARIIFLQLCVFCFPLFSSASNLLYQVAFYSSEANEDFIQSLLADWSAQDLGPTRLFLPMQGSRYFYFQMDEELVEDLFFDLSQKGEVYVEKSLQRKAVPKGKVQFVLWFFPHQDPPEVEASWELTKGSSKASQRMEQIEERFRSLKIETTRSEKWKNTFWYNVSHERFLLSLASRELINGIFRLNPGIRDPQDSVSVLLSVRDIRTRGGEAIEEGTPKSPKPTEGFDLEFRLLPALPLDDAEVDELSSELKPLIRAWDETTRRGNQIFEIEVENKNIARVLRVFGHHGLLRMLAVGDQILRKKFLRLRVSAQESDDVMRSVLDLPETMGDQIQDRYKTELDVLYSGNQGTGSGEWISAMDVTLRRWFGKFGLRGNYVETARAPSIDYSQMLGALFQYRYHWKKARYGQSLIGGLVYKQIRSSSNTGGFGGVGLAYTDDMWRIVAWAFELLPFFRRPKTVELNIEYLPLTLANDVLTPTAAVISLKGFVHRSQRLKLIGAFYYHNFQYGIDELSNGVRVANSSITNTLYSIQFGLGFRF